MRSEKRSSRAIVLLFVSKHFQSFDPLGKFFMKSPIFDISCGSFPIYSWFRGAVTGFLKLILQLFFVFIVAFLFFNH